MIQAENIHKYYGNLHVVKGVSLEIKKGEFISIVGKSGAGKSTLLHILGTLDKPTEGTVLYQDLDVTHLDGRPLANFRNNKIGFIFQFHHLLAEFTALENAMIPALIKKTPPKEARQKATELLDYLGLNERLEHKPSELSGGEQQRVAIARSLINTPDVVLADEPTGNLDSSTSQEIHNLLFKLRSDFNCTFIVVTHNEELANLSDRKLTMQDGILI